MKNNFIKAVRAVLIFALGVILMHMSLDAAHDSNITAKPPGSVVVNNGQVVPPSHIAR